MKKILFLIIVSFQNVSWSAQSITLEMVTEKVKEQNLTVLQNAERVYQARTSIDEARLNMLPKLNIWSIGKVIIDPTALLDLAQDFVPFLVPANWFRLKETELLFQAERDGYLALKANELFAARSLYLKVLMDQDLYQSLKRFESEFASVRLVVEDRYDLGLEEAEVVREIQIQHLNLMEDLVQLKLLVDFEKTELAQALGISVKEEIVLSSINLPTGEVNLPIDPKDWEEQVLKKSPEISQFVSFLKVIPYLKKEVRFSFLGVAAISRGTAGGIFDDMPISQGLGFANGKQIDIISSKGKVLELQKKGVEETLRRQLINVSQDHNSSLQLRSLREQRLNLSELNFKSYLEKLSIGGQLSLPQFTQTMLSFLQSQASYYETFYGFMTNYDRLQRLSFTGAYERVGEGKLPSNKEESEPRCRKTIFGRTVCEKEKLND